MKTYSLESIEINKFLIYVDEGVLELRWQWSEDMDRQNTDKKGWQPQLYINICEKKMHMAYFSVIGINRALFADKWNPNNKNHVFSVISTVGQIL